MQHKNKFYTSFTLLYFMNNSEALKYIIEENKINEIGIMGLRIDESNYFDFENIIKDVVTFLWIKQNPEHFLNCYVTTNEYDTNKCSGYSWYISMKNSKFCMKEYKITGYDQYILEKENKKSEFFDRMNSIIDSAKNSDNIILWCIDHFKI